MRLLPRRFRGASRAPLILLLVVPLVLLAACASGDGGGSADGSPPSAPSSSAPSTPAEPTGGMDQADNDLQVELDRGDGSPVEQYRLTCVGVAEGTLPDAEAVCAHLEGLADPFAPLAADVMCAEVYGGPQTARVTGRWHGSAVDLQLARTNACRTAQWDSLGPLLPGPTA
jgi:hypothetical protein